MAIGRVRRAEFDALKAEVAALGSLAENLISPSSEANTGSRAAYMREYRKKKKEGKL
jgi:hypothetical protein